jgi:protein-L-isoaspartate(D-aspartate) O-methyltransferase
MLGCVRPILLSLSALLLAACGPRSPAKLGPDSTMTTRTTRANEPTPDLEHAARQALVDEHLRGRMVDDERVLAAMLAVPRHRFVPVDLRAYAYEDRPLPIGHGVTISQPFIVALMSQVAEVEPGDRVLEVGTGSGYQAAVLAELGAEVYTIERIEALAEGAAAVLAELGYAEVQVRYGDGYAGWPEHAPFDAILLTAAPASLPEALLEQLAVGGRLVAPVGAAGGAQELVVVERTPKGLRQRRVVDVAFVPMLPGKE